MLALKLMNHGDNSAHIRKTVQKMQHIWVIVGHVLVGRDEKKVAREQYKKKEGKRKKRTKEMLIPPSTREAVSSGAMWTTAGGRAVWLAWKSKKKKSLHSLQHTV